MAVSPSRRRERISYLIDRGDPITPATRKELASEFGCSISAIYVDIRICLGGMSANRWRAYEQVAGQNKRCARLGVPGVLRVSEWVDYCERLGYRCVRCGSTRSPSIDHVIPISRGGTNTMDNVQLLCQPCNSGKRDR